jgi:hypothetical protein
MKRRTQIGIVVVAGVLLVAMIAAVAVLVLRTRSQDPAEAKKIACTWLGEKWGCDIEGMVSTGVLKCTTEPGVNGSVNVYIEWNGYKPVYFKGKIPWDWNEVWIEVVDGEVVSFM